MSQPWNVAESHAKLPRCPSQLTPCFLSHSSLSCSTRETWRSKCSALTSTWRSLSKNYQLSEPCATTIELNILSLRQAWQVKQHSLLRGLLQILLRLIQLLFQQLHLPSQVLPCRPVIITLVRSSFQIFHLALGSLELTFREGELVLKGRDLLITLEEGLIQLTSA